MGRREVGIAVAAVLVVGAVVVGRGCLKGAPSDQAAAPAGSEARPGAPARPGSRPGPGGSAAAAGSGAPGAKDAKSDPEVVINAPWGGKLGQLGRERPEEGNPEAPMSFTVDSKGRIVVLDQVNNRLVRHGPDGKPLAEVPIELRTAQDVVVAADGTTAVLERYREQSVTLYDESGKVIGSLPLAGEGIDKPGHVTGVIVDGKDVYAEREHGPLVKLGDTSGRPAEPREELPGRPSRDGKLLLSAGIIQAQAGRAYVSAMDRARRENRFTRELRMEGQIRAILLLDSDLAGTIYFAMQVHPGAGEDMVILTCLEPASGQPVGEAVMPANTMAEETFRDLAVLDEGGVVYAHRTEAGTTYTRYDCQ